MKGKMVVVGGEELFKYFLSNYCAADAAPDKRDNVVEKTVMVSGFMEFNLVAEKDIN